MSQIPRLSVRPGPRSAGILMILGLTLGGGHARAGLPTVGAEGPSGAARRESASPEGKVSQRV